MDKRGEPRVPHDIRFFVHVSECADDPELVGVSVKCEAIDFSTRGLQLRTDTKLPQHARLNITIGIGEPFAMYLLSGEIRWVRGEGDDICMGILLEEIEGTDYGKWVVEFPTIFSA